MQTPNGCGQILALVAVLQLLKAVTEKSGRFECTRILRSQLVGLKSPFPTVLAREPVGGEHPLEFGRHILIAEALRNGRHSM